MVVWIIGLMVVFSCVWVVSIHQFGTIPQNKAILKKLENQYVVDQALENNYRHVLNTLTSQGTKKVEELGKLEQEAYVEATMSIDRIQKNGATEQERTAYVEEAERIVKLGRREEIATIIGLYLLSNITVFGYLIFNSNLWMVVLGLSYAVAIQFIQKHGHAELKAESMSDLTLGIVTAVLALIWVLPSILIFFT